MGKISILALINATLPKKVSRLYKHYIYTSAALVGVAASMIGSQYSVFIVSSLSCGVLLLVAGLIKKRHIIYAGYKEGVFVTYDYTYIHRYQKKPTGILLLPPDKSFNGTYLHVAISGGDVPPLGSKVRLIIPGDAELRRYKDRVYFPTVYGYEIEE